MIERGDAPCFQVNFQLKAPANLDLLPPGELNYFPPSPWFVGLGLCDRRIGGYIQLRTGGRKKSSLPGGIPTNPSFLGLFIPSYGRPLRDIRKNVSATEPQGERQDSNGGSHKLGVLPSLLFRMLHLLGDLHGADSEGGGGSVARIRAREVAWSSIWKETLVRSSTDRTEACSSTSYGGLRCFAPYNVTIRKPRTKLGGEIRCYPDQIVACLGRRLCNSRNGDHLYGYVSRSQTLRVRVRAIHILPHW